MSFNRKLPNHPYADFQSRAKKIVKTASFAQKRHDKSWRAVAWKSVAGYVLRAQYAQDPPADFIKAAGQKRAIHCDSGRRNYTMEKAKTQSVIDVAMLHCSSPIIGCRLNLLYKIIYSRLAALGQKRFFRLFKTPSSPRIDESLSGPDETLS